MAFDKEEVQQLKQILNDRFLEEREYTKKLIDERLEKGLIEERGYTKSLIDERLDERFLEERKHTQKIIDARLLEERKYLNQTLLGERECTKKLINERFVEERKHIHDMIVGVVGTALEDIVLPRLSDIEDKLAEHDKRFDQLDRKFEAVGDIIGHHTIRIKELEIKTAQI